MISSVRRPHRPSLLAVLIAGAIHAAALQANALPPAVRPAPVVHAATALHAAAAVPASPPEASRQGTPARIEGPRPGATDLARQVVIRRTEYGVPHILAENLRAAYFAMGWLQVEDYGERVVRGLLQARGEMGLAFGPDSMGGDFMARLRRARAVETYHLNDADTRDVYEGFAAGVNRYIELHPDEFGGWAEPIFTGHDVAATGVGWANPGSARRFLSRIRSVDDSGAAWEDPAEGDDTGPHADPEDGSNAWAFSPARTASGHAILLRNPHLSWSAGYYEAHVTVPGVLNFYGDFRIGSPFGVIGGFNDRLGWATTNNNPDLDEIYALRADPHRADHYLFDGGSVPVRRVAVTVEFRNGEAIGTETREFLFTPLGPVIHRGDGRIHVLRAAGHGEYRVGEQFLRMMKASNLEEWKEAMRMRARTASNFTYADADGNILYVWNATVPALPHPPGGDTVAIPADGTGGIWTLPVAFDSLPQLLNPPGGYVRNENDPPYFTNLHHVLDRGSFPPGFPEPMLRLRSQHSLELIHNDRVFSLEDVVQLKHSMRMLLADRVKDDLVAAVRRALAAPAAEAESAEPAEPAPRREQVGVATGGAVVSASQVAGAIALLEAWDNTVAADSRGGVLFETWWRRYSSRVEGESPFAEPWSADRPTETPVGLASPEVAADAFVEAVAEATKRFGGWDVAWGDVHRVRHGDVDAPVGGCSGALGCFRVLSFRDQDDGTRSVVGGDGWVLAVEFSDPPRAFSVLAYGQSAREESPHHADQARMFARNEMKPVAFTEDEIRRRAIRTYRPGDPARR